MVRVDAHHHLWDPVRGDYPWMPTEGVLARPYLGDDLAAMRRETGANATIVVQAAPTVTETEFLMSLAAADDTILGVVGWVQLDAPRDAVAADLERLRRLGPLVGIRPMIQDIDDPDWLSRPLVRESLELLAAADLTFDLLCREPQLPTVVDELTTRHPQLRVCVDHLAKPDYSELSARWRNAMARLADLPHAYCKISGLVTEVAGPPSADRLQAHVECALDLFGPQRCMYGSDWPVCRLATEPGDVVRIAEQLISHLSSTEREHIWWKAASACYRLGDELGVGA